MPFEKDWIAVGYGEGQPSDDQISVANVLVANFNNLFFEHFDKWINVYRLEVFQRFGMFDEFPEITETNIRKHYFLLQVEIRKDRINLWDNNYVVILVSVSWSDREIEVLLSVTTKSIFYISSNDCSSYNCDWTDAKWTSTRERVQESSGVPQWPTNEEKNKRFTILIQTNLKPEPNFLDANAHFFSIV